METFATNKGGPSAQLKGSASWTDVIQASHERNVPTRSQLTPAGSPLPSESDHNVSAACSEPDLTPEPASEDRSGSPEADVEHAPAVTDYAGRRLEYARPLGVHQSAVAPRILGYPSTLHSVGRLMVMVVVTGICVYPQLREAPALPSALTLEPLVNSLDLETFTGGVRLNLLHI